MCAHGHVRAQAPQAEAAQKHCARLQPGARLPRQGLGEGVGVAAQGHQGGEGAAATAAAALPVHVVQGVQRLVREHAQEDAA